MYFSLGVTLPPTPTPFAYVTDDMLEHITTLNRAVETYGVTPYDRSGQKVPWIQRR